MNPREYKYTKEHEWIRRDTGGTGKVGITDYAQALFGDIVFLDLPSPDTQVTQFEKLGEVEAVKAVSDLFSPASGIVLEINQVAINDPKLVNEDPYGTGWLVKLELSQPSELETMMNNDEYNQFLVGLRQEGSE